MEHARILFINGAHHLIMVCMVVSMVKANMIQRRTKQLTPSFYDVLDEKITQSRTYQLIRFSIPKQSSKIRRRIMEKILDESDAIGLIEWWSKGSIIHKPKWEFYSILVLEYNGGY